jgi:hypothetical protein
MVEAMRAALRFAPSRPQTKVFGREKTPLSVGVATASTWCFQAPAQTVSPRASQKPYRLEISWDCEFPSRRRVVSQ